MTQAPKLSFDASRELDPKKIRLIRTSSDKVELQIQNGLRHAPIEIIRAAPLSEPDRYICFLDDKGTEIGMIQDIQELEPESREVAEEALKARYLTALILRIHSVKRESGATHLEVETDRGRREFMIQNPDEGLRWLGDERLLLIDVDGNRFEVTDLSSLDSASRRLLNRIIE